MPEEKKQEEKKEEKLSEKEEKKEVEIPAKFKSLVEEIEKMSVLDLAELVKILEEKFGVSSSAPVAMMAVAGVGGDSASATEEKSSFNVELKEVGGQKIAVIKVVKEITGKGLKDAKDLVDKAPAVIKENVARAFFASSSLPNLNWHIP